MLNGKQIAAKLVARGACKESIAWLRANGDKTFGWLWAACPDAQWFWWIADRVCHQGDVGDRLWEAWVRSPDEARAEVMYVLRNTGWGASLAVLRALEAL